MKFVSSVALAAAVLSNLAGAVPVESSQPDASASPIKVTIAKAAGNGMVLATVTNVGKETLNILKTSQLLDSEPVKKLDVSKDGKATPFHGLRIHRDASNLQAKNFEQLAPGKSIETTIDVAHAYDMSQTGDYSIVAEGYIQATLASLNGTDRIWIDNMLPYTSNTIDILVDGKAGARSKRDFKRIYSRSKLMQNCQGQQGAAVQDSLGNCAKMAQQASQAALNGDPKVFQMYFKTTDSQTRKQVSDRYAAIAKECGATNGGITRFHCQTNDVGTVHTTNACTNGDVLAFTTGLDGPADIWTCPLFYQINQTPKTCGNNDAGSTTLHEMSHNSKVFSPGTQDLGAYGARGCTQLSARDALRNADTYAFYSSFVALGCTEINGRPGPVTYKPVAPGSNGLGGGSQGGNGGGSQGGNGGGSQGGNGGSQGGNGGGSQGGNGGGQSGNGGSHGGNGGSHGGNGGGSQGGNGGGSQGGNGGGSQGGNGGGSQGGNGGGSQGGNGGGSDYPPPSSGNGGDQGGDDGSDYPPFGGDQGGDDGSSFPFFGGDQGGNGGSGYPPFGNGGNGGGSGTWTKTTCHNGQCTTTRGTGAMPQDSKSTQGGQGSQGGNWWSDFINSLYKKFGGSKAAAPAPAPAPAPSAPAASPSAGAPADKDCDKKKGGN